MVTSREVHLKSRPAGALRPDNFGLVTVELPSPGADEVLIKNLWMSIDAGQRTLMGEGSSDIADLPPKRFELDEPMEGQAIGQIVESRNPNLPVGTFVITNLGWREYALFSGAPDGFTLRVLDAPVGPIQSYLHIQSLYGALAYFLVTDCARVRAGETVWVSTAAGTTGSITSQISQLSGCKVIGTTGSDEKVEWLKDELGLDAAFNYKRSDLRDAVQAACPEGVDVYFDFAGGAQLEAAIDAMNPHGRIIKIGDTATYDGEAAAGPANIFQVVLKRLSIQGCTIFDYLTTPARMATAYARLSKWIAAGKITAHETVYEGIENAAQAQIDLFQGKNLGKMLVRLGEPEAFG